MSMLWLSRDEDVYVGQVRSLGEKPFVLQPVVARIAPESGYKYSCDISRRPRKTRSQSHRTGGKRPPHRTVIQDLYSSVCPSACLSGIRELKVFAFVDGTDSLAR